MTSRGVSSVHRVATIEKLGEGRKSDFDKFVGNKMYKI